MRKMPTIFLILAMLFLTACNATPNRYSEKDFLNLVKKERIEVHGVKQSLYETFFKETREAKWISTDLGVIDVVFFPGSTDAESIIVRESKTSPLTNYKYAVAGKDPTDTPTIQSNRPLYFTAHRNLFIITDNPELDGALKEVLREKR